MACSYINTYLREHPDGNLPDGAAAHLRGCAGCRALYREMTGLDALLADLPAAELPAYFPARLQAKLRAPRRPAFALRPLLVPLAAAAVGLALVFFASVRLVQYPSRLSRQDRPAPSAVQPAVPAPGAAQAIVAATGTRIYPVWPADQDVVAGDDLTITASLYPADRGATAVRVIVDDRDLTGDSEITQDYLAVVPKNLAPGEHVVTVSYQPADGGRRSVSWSFYLLEETS
jgi:hypothetical protein